MKEYFRDPYQDELLYSNIARIYFTSGKSNIKSVLVDIYNKSTKIPSIYFPSNLKAFCDNIPNEQYTPEYLINNHTLFPIYSPFLTVYRRNEIMQEMIYSNGNGLYTKLGAAAGSICRELKVLTYCPVCVVNDFNKYGEAYFHRIHQVQGVFVCPEHGCKLKEYPTNYKNTSRINYIRLDHRNIDLNVEQDKDFNIQDKLKRIAISAKYILDGNCMGWNIENIYKNYKNYLGKMGLLTAKGNVKQELLYEQFKEYYNDDFLNLYESNFNVLDESSWLKNITRKQKNIIHPIRHILFILFLCGDVEKFFSKPVLYQPFGKGPWYCLNPAADHYHNKVVTDLKITDDYKTREPVGTFTCSCVFIYSRKGPDINEDDAYKIGRIKEFGQVWENKLRCLIITRRYGIRQLGQLMGCDPKTIVKYAKRLGLENYIESSMNFNFKNTPRKTFSSVDHEKIYKNKVTMAANEYSNLSRTQLRNLIQKEYTWLYRHDRMWLYNNLPKRMKVKNNDYKCNTRVNWDKRDTEILDMIQNAYKQVMKNNKLVRVTKSLLSRLIGKSTLLNNYLDKLPQTKQYINSIVETINDFQIRRLEIISKKVYNEKGYLSKWQVVRKAGLRPSYVLKLGGYINKIIGKYNMNN